MRLPSQRFNPEIDKKNNYRTKTVLAVPIFESENKNVIGVLQAINKLDGFFTKDDEGLINILAGLAQVVLRNSIYHDEKQAFHNSLRVLLKVGYLPAGTIDIELWRMRASAYKG